MTTKVDENHWSDVGPPHSGAGVDHMSTAASLSAQNTADTTLDPKLLRIAVVISVGSLMSILDTTIVNVAISALAKSFGTSLAVIQWVATGYMLALATVIPLTAGLPIASESNVSTSYRLPYLSSAQRSAERHGRRVR
jgi:hypothetical protein